MALRGSRNRADHNTTSEMVGDPVDGHEASSLSTRTKLEQGRAVVVYDGETYIKLASQLVQN